MVNEINNVPTISSTNSSNVNLNCFGGFQLDFMFNHIGFVVNLEMENMLMQQQSPQSDVMYSSHGEDPLVSSVNDSFGSLSLQCAHPLS